ENMTRIPADLEGLKLSLSDIYYGNFSLLQSLRDTWTIDQLFPIAPLHRLNEEPKRSAVIADITCDCDGKIDSFIGEEEISKVLPLHALREGEEYYLSVFRVGAYQERLGDLHNLFGDTNVVSVRINRDGSYHFVKEMHGDTIADVLSYVEFDPKEMQLRHRNTAEQAVRDGRITARERQQIIKLFNDSMNGYTYYEKDDCGRSFVVPAQAGAQLFRHIACGAVLDPGLRRDDGVGECSSSRCPPACFAIG